MQNQYLPHRVGIPVGGCKDDSVSDPDTNNSRPYFQLGKGLKKFGLLRKIYLNLHQAKWSDPSGFESQILIFVIYSLKNN